MTQTNPPSRKGPGTRNLKLLVTTLSLTTTLSGWALLALNRPPSTDVAAADPTDTAAEQPTSAPPPSAPLPSPTAVPTSEPAMVIPSLASLPVRGLPEVGNPA